MNEKMPAKDESKKGSDSPGRPADDYGLAGGLGTSVGLTAVPGLRVGHATDAQAVTGCTVVLLPSAGAVAGVDVRGAAPGTRETDLLRPEALIERVHAILLTGGSAFGLAAAGGVMGWLEEQGIGHDVGVARVPLVPAAVLFDLAVGDVSVRPDAAMGYAACQAASSQPAAEGSVGAGTGATIGKLLGPAGVMKGGVGTASLRLEGGATVGALVAVNAVGDIYHPETGQKLAGTRQPDGKKLLDTRAWLRRGVAPDPRGNPPGTNTTLAVVATDATLNPADVQRVASMAHNGLARTILPVHTSMDGDTIFALATGGQRASADAVGAAAAQVLAAAVVRAVHRATSLPGIPALADMPVL